MEKSIGKRIVENRKRLGLTQEALAEQLGVTAQAVSKWENDQSCPDISILIHLCDIFGITTDELLGKEKVHEAEVITEAENKESKGKWEVTWESGRKSSIFFALGVLIFGSLLMASRILSWEVSWWDILWPTFLLMAGLNGLLPNFSFLGLGCTVFGGYFLISNLGIWQLSFSGDLIFPAIVLIFGLSLLADALKKPHKPRFRIVKDGKEMGSGKENAVDNCITGETTFESEVTFGNISHEITLDTLNHGEISCSFGNLKIDLSGCTNVSEDCTVEADCSFGQLTILVPRRFRVEADSDTTFANLKILGHPDDAPAGIIHLNADISFGNIEIRYI